MLELNTTTVEVLEHDAGESGQGLSQSDFNGCLEIRASTSESVMLFLDDFENNVTGFLVRDLVSLTLKDNLISLPKRLLAHSLPESQTQ